MSESTTDEIEVTPTRVRAYIQAKGRKCLFCGDGNIEGQGGMEIDGDSAWQRVRCAECDAEWRDVYFLGAIDVLDENGRYVKTVEPDSK